MLRKIYSDLSNFKTVKFHSGLNLVLAEKETKSSDGQTRNGAGKSSLVELINSLLGSDLRKGNILKNKTLLGHRFGLEIDFAGEVVTIERGGSAPKYIYVKSMPNKFLSVSELNGEYFIYNDEWLSVLGSNIFGITAGIKEIKGGPSFRTLFSYFARSSKGFDTPEKTYPLQSTASVQVALSYLLKLNWKISKSFEEIRQKDKLIKALKVAANEGALGDIMGSASDLRTDILLKKSKAEKLNKAILDFKVLPEYQENELRVSEISKQLANLSAEDSTDKEWLAQLDRALENEIVPDRSKIERLFTEAKVDLPSIVTKRLDEVQAFHESVISNRKEHLRQEIAEISNRIEHRYNQKQVLDAERSKIFSLLQSHGALDQYIQLQKILSKLEGEIEVLNKKLEATENLDHKKSDLKIERHNLQKKMQIDHVERDKVIADAIISFAEISSRLYDEPGKFVIDPSDNGPKFEFDIPGKKSTGKTKMQIFCFDMTLMKLWANENKRPDILIHDSLIFDGVDERQIAKALVIGAEMAELYNFQYIVTMNSDDVPDMSHYPEFDLKKYRVNLDITDTKTGGLFGLRFE